MNAGYGQVYLQSLVTVISIPNGRPSPLTERFGFSTTDPYQQVYISTIYVTIPLVLIRTT